MKDRISEKQKEIGRIIKENRPENVKDYHIFKETNMIGSQLKKIEDGEGMYSFRNLLTYLDFLNLDIKIIKSDEKE